MGNGIEITEEGVDNWINITEEGVHDERSWDEAKYEGGGVGDGDNVFCRVWNVGGAREKPV
jgi:hypothetical protein